MYNVHPEQFYLCWVYYHVESIFNVKHENILSIKILKRIISIGRKTERRKSIRR